MPPTLSRLTSTDPAAADAAAEAQAQDETWNAAIEAAAKACDARAVEYLEWAKKEKKGSQIYYNYNEVAAEAYTCAELVRALKRQPDGEPNYGD